MKLLNSINALALCSLLAITSCTIKREITTVNPNAIAPAQFTSYPTGTILLNKLEPTSTLLTMAWQEAKYGYDAAVQYTVEAFDTTANVMIGQTYSNSIAVQNKDLNSLLLNSFNALPGDTTELQIRLISSIGTLIPKFDTISAPALLSIVPYSGEATPLWLVGGYNGWDHANDIALYSEMSNGIYQGWAPLLGSNAPQGADTEFKFTPEQNWNSDYGSADGNDITSLMAGGANIALPGGILYFLTVDLNTMIGTIENNSITRIGLIGDATPNGWDSPDTELTYDPQEKVFIATDVEMTNSGGFKFRANNTWGVLEWGNNGVDGELNLMGGGDDNIIFDLPSGTYTVKLNLFTLTPTYEFIAQ